MNCTSITACAVFLMLTLCSASTEAAVSNSGSLQSPDLKSPVQPGSKTTYFDLLRKVFPDLQTDSTHDDASIAHGSVPIRKIDDQRESIVLESDIEIKGFDSRWIKSGGRRLLLLSADLSADDANEGTPYEGEATVLAVFGLEPKIELLDVMDIKSDRFTAFWEDHPLVHLNSQNDAFVIYSTHSNAGENYNDLALMFVDDGRFKIISSFFLFNTHGCGAMFTESPSFRALPAIGRKYPKILVTVRLKKNADTDGCDRRTRGYTRYYNALYYWKQAKTQYESDSRQLEKLDRFNRARL
ncbi:MAG TPA: hypothetical protein VNS63_19635 [Blastocatellia bacterium]|nr:hypothetical protein [Blastocatellia bacterium]